MERADSQTIGQLREKDSNFNPPVNTPRERATPGGTSEHTSPSLAREQPHSDVDEEELQTLPFPFGEVRCRQWVVDRSSTITAPRPEPDLYNLVTTCRHHER